MASAIGLLLWITLLVVRRKLTARPFKLVPQFTVKRLGYLCWVLALFVTLVPAVILLRYLAIPVLAIGWTCVISAMVQSRKEELRLLRSLILSVVGGRGSLPDAIEQFAVDMRSEFSLRCRCFADCLRRGQSPAQAAKSSGIALAVDALVAMEQSPGKAEVESETEARFAPNTISKTNGAFEEWTSWSIPNQLIYLAAIIVTLAILPIFLSRLLAPLWTLSSEFGIGMNSTLALISEHHANVSSLSLLVALIAVVWIALVLLCYLRPSRWLVRITPWFGDWLLTRRRCDGLQSLASGLRRGQPITEVLSSIEQLTRSRWIRRQTSSTMRQIQRGQPLAKSLLSAGYVNGVESSWIDAAAATGHLPNALESIVEDVTRQYELKWRIRLAWMVPAALLVMGAYVCIFVYWMMGTLYQLILALT